MDLLLQLQSNAFENKVWVLQQNKRKMRLNLRRLVRRRLIRPPLIKMLRLLLTLKKFPLVCNAGF
jgi:hypothetical protein